MDKRITLQHIYIYIYIYIYLWKSPIIVNSPCFYMKKHSEFRSQKNMPFLRTGSRSSFSGMMRWGHCWSFVVTHCGCFWVSLSMISETDLIWKGGAISPILVSYIVTRSSWHSSWSVSCSGYCEAAPHYPKQTGTCHIPIRGHRQGQTPTDKWIRRQIGKTYA